MGQRVTTLRAAFGGMDLRPPGSAGPSSCALALNVDFHRGLVEARAPVQAVSSLLMPASARLHVIDRPGVPRRLLAVGPDPDGSGVQYQVVNLSTLTAEEDVRQLDGYGGPGGPVEHFECSFLDTFLASSDGAVRPATLVCTSSGVFVYEPLVSLFMLRQGDTSTDSAQLEHLSFAYWIGTPCGSIATMHRGRAVYAGFSQGQQAPLTSPLDLVQTGIPEALIPSAGRGYVGLDASVVYLSDEYDPLGIRGDHVFLVDAGERVTGLLSQNEVLYVFSSGGVYALTGTDASTFSLSKVVVNPGGLACVSHASIVVVGGVIYFMSARGPCAFGGVMQPEVIHVGAPLGPMFESRGALRERVPAAVLERASVVGWPWSVAPTELRYSVGRYCESRDQIWWSLPLGEGWRAGAMPGTAVFNVTGKAWALYAGVVSPRRTRGMYAGCFTDGVNVNGEWLTSNDVGELCVFGRGVSDGPVSTVTGPLSVARGVMMAWVSGRLQAEGEAFVNVEELRLTGWSTGVFSTLGAMSSSQPSAAYDLPTWVVEGEEAAFDGETTEGAVNADADTRRTRGGNFSMVGNSGTRGLWGTMVWGTDVWGAADWCRVRYPVGLRSKTFRIGLVDWSYTNVTRPSALVLSQVSLELTPEGLHK